MAVAVRTAQSSTVAPYGSTPPVAQRLRAHPARPASLETPQLTVVIVNFCQWRNTARLARQLRRCEAIRRGAAEIVIVDNHSPPTSLTRKLRRLSGVTIIRNPRNHGFARAVNRGSHLSGGEWILLLNPDTTVPDGFLDQVLESAQRWPAHDPSAGVVGFQLRNRDGTRQASSGVFPTLVGTVGRLVLPRSRRKCRHLAERQPVPWVTGGCLLVRRDCFEGIGGLDETFFLYYEDVDFCQRARAAGWSVWYEPDLQVTHHFPLHTRSVPAPLRLVTRHALLTYSRKHWPGWQTRLLAAIVWSEAGARELLARARRQPSAADCYRQLRHLVGDVLQNRHGPIADRIRYAARQLDPIAAAHDGRTD